MDDRRGPYGGAGGAVFSQRAQKWWKIAPAKQHKVERLIAILAGSHGVILGDWDVDVRSGYGPNGDVFPLVDPADDDPRKIKGMRLVGVSGQRSEEHTSELQSRFDLVCRLLLEKK